MSAGLYFLWQTFVKAFHPTLLWWDTWLGPITGRQCCLVSVSLYFSRLHPLSVDPWTTAEESFFLGISLVFSRTTWLRLGPFLRVPLHWCPFNSWHFQTSSMCAMKSVAGWGSEGWVDIIAGGRTGLPKHFIMALACMSWTRRTIQSTAGTSKGWKTQAITLVLSF